MSDELRHEYEDNIICPYCHHENEDSWEYEGGECGEYSCGSCGADFNVEQHTKVTYSTSRINCEQKLSQHNYERLYEYLRMREFTDGRWVDLPEGEHVTVTISECKTCGHRQYLEGDKL